MVFVPRIEPDGAVEILGLPCGVIREIVPAVFFNVPETVRFEICFCDKVKAEAVAKFRQARVAWIVARADHIHMVLTQNPQIAQHMILGRGLTKQRMAVVAVDAARLDRAAVDEHDASAHLDFARAGRDHDMLRAVSYVQFIEVWRLGGPERRIFQRKGHGLAFDFSGRARILSLSVKQAQNGAAKQAARNFGAKNRAGKIVGKRALDRNIGDMPFRPEEQVYLAENAAIPKHILVLEVGRGGKFDDQNLDRIGSRPQEFCHVDLAYAVRNLAVGRKAVVDPKIETGGHTLKIQIDFFAAKTPFLQKNAAAVERTRILVGHRGRLARKRIFYVRIIRRIVAAAKHRLPRPGHVHFVRGKAVEFPDIQRLDLKRRMKKAEIPRAAQRAEIRALHPSAAERALHRIVGDKIGAGRLAADVHDAELSVIGFK